MTSQLLGSFRAWHFAACAHVCCQRLIVLLLLLLLLLRVRRKSDAAKMSLEVPKKALGGHPVPRM